MMMMIIIIIIIMTPNKLISDITDNLSSVITKHVLPSGGVLLTNSAYHMVSMAITPTFDVTRNDLVSNYHNRVTMTTGCDTLTHTRIVYTV